MPVEIERKFLVVGDAWRAGSPMRIAQGYLCRDKNRTVRIRMANDRGFITVKGISVGASRSEFEYEIPLDDAKVLLELCDQPLLDKARYRIAHGELLWEVDEFAGANVGLVVAEVELKAEGQTFNKPAWIGKEVTEDPRYYNSNLASNPYTQWS